MLFTKYTESVCWICCSRGPLTGEHKIKRTDLRKDGVFPRYFEGKGKKRKLQSENAKLLKFPDCICERCNNERTQQADHAYAQFRDASNQTILKTVTTEVSKLELSTSAPPTKYELELLRYFAKHLGCMLDYNKFPVPRRLASFVRSKSNSPCVSVSFQAAPFKYQETEDGQIHTLSSIGQIVFGCGKAWLPNDAWYQTAFTNAGLQFAIRMELSRFEGREVRTAFIRRGKTLAEMPDDVWVHAGLGKKVDE